MSNLMIGIKIVEVKIASDKEAMLFVTDVGEKLIAKVDGDCCSTSWIESVELPALGLPFTILAIDDLDMDKEPDETDGDYIQFYGVKLTTDKGDMVIDYRNSSNGYYGGSISWPGEEYYYGGVYGQNVSSEEWQDIVDAG